MVEFLQMVFISFAVGMTMGAIGILFVLLLEQALQHRRAMQFTSKRYKHEVPGFGGVFFHEGNQPTYLGYPIVENPHLGQEGVSLERTDNIELLADSLTRKGRELLR